MTQDGVLVLCHDARLSPDLARLDGRWLARPTPWLHRMAWPELKRLDVGRTRPGSAPARAFPAQAAIDGAPIPRLEDALRLPAHWTIEIKTDPSRPHTTARPEVIAEAVAHAVDAAGARAVLPSVAWRRPPPQRRLRP